VIKPEDFNAKELALKHVYLMQEIEQLPPGTEISPEKRKEIKELEAELKRKLIKNLTGDPFPVTKKEEK